MSLPISLRAQAPWRVFDGYGRAVREAGRFLAIRSLDELLSAFEQARREGLSVTFRGAGRSYGDAALNAPGVVLDLNALDRVLAWDASTGVIDVEPGVTIEGLWRRALPDGWWPPVVPGTMKATLGGCLSANVHGKNNFKAGPIGEHVLGLELVTPGGERLWCTPDEHPELFHGAIGGMGLLGAITRARLRLKRVESGRVQVEALYAPNLGRMFELFEERLPRSDYLVGWVDCLSTGAALGRGQIHQANHLSANDDPEGAAWLGPGRQELPARILGFPKSQLWRVMALFMNNPGAWLVNRLKSLSARLQHGHVFRQSLVAFSFLLDYVPDWRLAYGPEGFIQHQLFVPAATARPTFEKVLRTCREAGLPSYLGVLKRHRPDGFLLSHAVDGYSLAMDFKVTRGNREALFRLTRRITEMALNAGGRFYLAKDAVLSAPEFAAGLGSERLATFTALRQRVDPAGLLSSSLERRLSLSA